MKRKKNCFQVFIRRLMGNRLWGASKEPLQQPTTYADDTTALRYLAIPNMTSELDIIEEIKRRIGFKMDLAIVTEITQLKQTLSLEFDQPIYPNCKDELKTALQKNKLIILQWRHVHRPNIVNTYTFHVWNYDDVLWSILYFDQDDAKKYQEGKYYYSEVLNRLSIGPIYTINETISNALCMSRYVDEHFRNPRRCIMVEALILCLPKDLANEITDFLV